MKDKVHIIITKQVHKKMDTWLTKINLNNILTVTRAISTTILFMYWLRLSTTPSTWTQIRVWSSMNWFLRPGTYMYMQDSVRSMCCYFSTERRQRNVKSGLVPPPRPAFPKPTNTQPSSHIKPKPPHTQHTEGVEAQSRSASGGPMAKKGSRERGGQQEMKKENSGIG